jgi:cyanate permease
MLATLAADLPRDQVVEDAVLDVRGRFSSLLARRYLPRTLIIWLVFALNLFTLYLLLGWLPTLLTRAGWSKSAAIHAAAILELGALAGALALAYFSQRGKLISALTGLFLIGSICLILLVVVGTSVWEWNLLIVVIGAGTAGSQLVLTALAACLYPTVIRAPA